jgi:gamma-glutamyl:cysteine ligase YbdK (ATP-grasp superfamily)
MGQEIETSQFGKAEFDEFERRLRRETQLLQVWFRNGEFSRSVGKGGFELEAWLVNKQARAASINEAYLQRLNNPLVVAELAQFNVEVNSTPVALRGEAFTRMAQELETTWVNCSRVAEDFNVRMAMIGILPTVGVEQLNLHHMSPLERFRALNEQILRLRAGCPIKLHIRGRDELYLQHADVMLEAAATSFQIHLKVTPEQAVRVYNAAKILSAPMVAVAANSPFLFGRDLWAETRIPLFEQSVAVGVSDLTKRVSFGIRYVNASVIECFQANLARYPVLLPQLMDEPPERMAHLRLHNGTIWRWNRPLVGFDSDGQPHLRIEHRVVPSGPSVMDSIANAALYFGMVQGLVREAVPAETRLLFERARYNFYAAARDGLEARIQWLNRRRVSLAELLQYELVPLARRGLRAIGIDEDDIRLWLDIIEARVRARRTGADWQRLFVRRHGADMQQLTWAYLARQASGKPVHEWDLNL